MAREVSFRIMGMRGSFKSRSVDPISGRGERAAQHEENKRVRVARYFVQSYSSLQETYSFTKGIPQVLVGSTICLQVSKIMKAP